MGRGMMDKSRFQRILKVLVAAYEAKPSFDGLSKEGMTAYYAVLGDLPPDLLEAATMHYVATSKWFPSAAELRETAFDLVDQANGRIGPYKAWGEVQKKVGTHGVYRGEPEFDDPAIAHAIAGVGGWRAICMAPENAIMSTRARFVDAFKQARQRERAETRMLPQIRELTKKLSAVDRPQLESET